MEISAEKIKLKTSSTYGIQREIKVKGQKLGTVTSYKYLREIVPDADSLKDCTSHCSFYIAEAIVER